MSFFKKNWGNIVFVLVLALFLIPQTGVPIKVFLTRLISFSPSKVSDTEVVTMEDYNWNLKALDDTSINLSQSKGNVILINFWATWCPPCIAEMPSLQALYNEYGDKVDFYFVSSEKPEMLSKFLQKKGYTFPVYIQFQEAPLELQSNALPTTYLISKSGEIIIKETGAADWNSDKTRKIIEELLFLNN